MRSMHLENEGDLRIAEESVAIESRLVALAAWMKELMAEQ